MELHDKAGWLVIILVLTCGFGYLLSHEGLYYDRVEITPGVAPIYELVPTTSQRMMGEFIYAMTQFAAIAFLFGLFARSFAKEAVM